MVKKRKILYIVIVIILFMFLFINFQYIGDNNPINGFIYSCYGYKFKLLKKSWTYKGEEYNIYGYYCLGIPYDYNSKNNCFKPYFIGGYCNYGL